MPELDGERDDLPASVRYVGACQWHPPESPGTLEWLDAIPSERPWVHVTEGTSRFQDHFLLEAAAKGLAGDSPLEAILVTGRGLECGRGRHRLAGGERARRRVVEPRRPAAALLGGRHHRGHGNDHGRAASGRAARRRCRPDGTSRRTPGVVDAGVGVRLSPRRCTPERLRAAVGEVYLDPSYRRNARRAAELLAAAPGPAGAAALIEGLAPARAPAAPTAAGGTGR